MSENEFERITELLSELSADEKTRHIAEELSYEFTSLKNKYVREAVRRENRMRLSDIRRVNEAFEDAIKNEEFLVYYQPKVNLKTYHAEGAEGLCRWMHEGKLVYPDRFIPALEYSGKIEELDFYVLEHVCKDIRRWIDSGKNAVQISVNFSRINIGKARLLERIIDTIDKYKVPHSYIQVELTETFTEVEFDDLRDLLLGLRDAGISTAVDDFGTGYSSLKLISELPWNVLKIDKSLLHEAEREGSNEHLMLRHIIGMVLDMGMECVVEGVETQNDVRILKDNKCFMAQGYYFDKPIACSEFEQVLERSGSNKKKQ